MYMMKKEATRNMIEFAWGIADFLGLDEPNYDDFEETRCFISHNVPFFYEKLEEVRNCANGYILRKSKNL